MRKLIFKVFIIFLIAFNLIVPVSICDDYIEEDYNIKDEVIETSASLISDGFIAEPKINSRSAIIYDRNSDTVLYGKNEYEQRKMASTTKIMTATIIIENCNLNDIVTISKRSANTGGSRLKLRTGDKISVNDLLYGLMMRSGNDSAVALAEYCAGSVEKFAEKMSQKAYELGLEHTHFETPHGLDSENHYTTAYELALLTDYALKNKIFANIVKTKSHTISINGIPRNLTNTNELLGVFNGVYGVKTGFTNGANRCLVTACKRGSLDVICVVLGADTKKYRTTDTIKLLNYTFDNFETINIEDLVNEVFNKWLSENSEKIFVKNARKSDIIAGSCPIDFVVDFSKLKNNYMPIRKDFKNEIKIEVNCPTEFEAPLKKDTKLGTINFYIKDSKLYELPIYSNNEIKRRCVFDYIKDLLFK